jgi:hypothetical protein
MKNPFRRNSSVGPLNVAGVTNIETGLAELRRINSLISQSMGIGIPGSDPLENISVQDKFIDGGNARKQYRALDVVQRIIDAAPKEALKNGFVIKTNYDKYNIGSLLMERLESFKYKSKMFEFLKNTRLYSRGTAIYPIIREAGMEKGRTHLEKTLYLENIEKIEDINIVREDMISYYTQSLDPHAVGFDQISDLHIGGRRVHESRYHIYIPNFDATLQRGTAILPRILLACQGLNVAQWTMIQLLLKYRAGILKYPAAEIAEIMAGKGNDKTPGGKYQALQQLIDKIKLAFTSKSIAAIPDNMSIEYLETTFTGIKEATDFLYSYTSTVSYTPQSIIKGSAMGELASAEKDERQFHDYIKSEEQSIKLNEALQFLFPFFIHEQCGEIYETCVKYGIDMNDINPQVVFNPLATVNPLTDAQVKNMNTQTAALAVQSNLLGIDEARKDLYPEKSDQYSVSSAELPDMKNDPLGLFNASRNIFPDILKNMRQIEQSKKVA